MEAILLKDMKMLKLSNSNARHRYLVVRSLDCQVTIL